LKRLSGKGIAADLTFVTRGDAPEDVEFNPIPSHTSLV
jgi:hypothetical protein